MTFAFIFDSVGGTEWILLLGVILIVVGPKNLPETARKFGKIMAQLRRAADEFKRQIMSMDQEVRRSVDEAVKSAYVDTPADAGVTNDDPYPGQEDFYDETNYEGYNSENDEPYNPVADASAGTDLPGDDNSSTVTTESKSSEVASATEVDVAAKPIEVKKPIELKQPVEPAKPKFDPYAVKITVSTNADKKNGVNG